MRGGTTTRWQREAGSTRSSLHDVKQAARLRSLLACFPLKHPALASVMGTDSPPGPIMAVQRDSTISAAPLLYSRSLPLRRTSTLAILRSEEKPYTSEQGEAGRQGAGGRLEDQMQGRVPA